MFTYHGWVEIAHQEHFQRWLDDEIDYPEYRKRLLEITTELKRIAENKFSIRDIDLKVMDGTNGIITIHISGHENHFSYGVEHLVHWIKENAPMSHGLIFFRDTEFDDCGNQYKVLRLAKNEVMELKDTYLSPVDEIVEVRLKEKKK